VEQLTFLVKGSAAEPYEVIFIKDGDSLTALCTCPAGQFGNVCKHRVAILDGDATAVCSDNAAQAGTIATWLQGTDVESALSEMRAADANADVDKSLRVAAKRKLARAMNS